MQQVMFGHPCWRVLMLACTHVVHVLSSTHVRHTLVQTPSHRDDSLQGVLVIASVCHTYSELRHLPWLQSLLHNCRQCSTVPWDQPTSDCMGSVLLSLHRHSLTHRFASVQMPQAGAQHTGQAQAQRSLLATIEELLRGGGGPVCEAYVADIEHVVDQTL